MRIFLIVEYGEAIRKTLSSKQDQERCSNLRVTKPSSSSSSEMRKASMILLVFLSYQSHGVSCETVL
jgi:hypothetical protein